MPPALAAVFARKFLLLTVATGKLDLFYLKSGKRSSKGENGIYL